MRRMVMAVTLITWPLAINCPVSAQSPTDASRPMLARDICMAPASKFASGASITFSDGRFKAIYGQGTMTVYEGAVPITQIPGFTFGELTHCLDTVLSYLERSRNSADSRSGLEMFNAGYELGEAINIGICMQSAAAAGFFLGDPNNAPMENSAIKVLATAASKSVARRIKRVSGQEIDLRLQDSMEFYNYFPNHFVPYFRSETIESSTEALEDAAPSDYEDQVKLGLTTAKLKNEFLFATIFYGQVEKTRGGFDPSSQRAQSYLPITLQCLENVYRQDSSRFLQIAHDLHLNVTLPNFSLALNNGSRAAQQPTADNSWAQRVFDDQVTVSLRGLIKQQ